MATASELITLYSSHAVHLERLGAGMGNAASEKLAAIDELIQVEISKFKKLDKSSMQSLRDKINEIMSQGIDELIEEMQIAQKQAALHEAAFNAKALGQVLITEPELNIPASALITKAAVSTPLKFGEGKYTTYKQLFSDFSAPIKKSIDNSITNGFVNGSTVNDVKNMILDDLPAITKNAESKARTIARTGLNHYATQARVAFGQANSDVITGWRSSGTLDSRTSDQCKALDGVIMTVEDSRWSAFVTPRHPNCRSSLTPEIDPKYKYDDSASQRPSKLGEEFERISAKKTYYEALKGLPKDRQDQLLGKTMGEAFRRLDNPDAFAKMTLDQKTLKPLTLKELEKKDNELGRIIKELRGK